MGVSHKRLGPIQRAIIAYLGTLENEGYLGAGMRSSSFDGLSFEQIETALDRLVVRKLVARRGSYFKLTETGQRATKKEGGP